MSEFKNTKEKTFEITVDDGIRTTFSGYTIFNQLNRQIDFYLGEENKWYIKSYYTRKNANNTTTFLAEVVIEETK